MGNILLKRYASYAHIQSTSSNIHGHQGHYDSVIHHYRESLLSTLPPSPHPLLVPALRRIYSLFFSSLPPLPHPATQETHPSLPPAGTLTHILHLAPMGAILPHVDNLEASGRVILGVSLGAERTLRLRRKFGDGEQGTDGEGWDVRLGSGSVYIQRYVPLQRSAFNVQRF